MISKVIIGRTFGCCSYVMKKEGAEILFSNGIRHDSISNAVKDFEAIRNLRPTLKNVVIHSSVSFAYEDKQHVTNDLMIEIGMKFQKRLGLSEFQTICVRHHDAKHEHFHLIINRVGYNREVASDHFIKNRAARTCDELEVEYGLTVARGHGISTSIKHRDKHKDKIKELIKSEIHSGLRSGITTLEMLTNFLAKQGIEMRVQYQSTGRVNGLSFKKENIALKGSEIDKAFSYKRLSKQLNLSVQIPSHIENKLNTNKQLDYER